MRTKAQISVEIKSLNDQISALFAEAEKRETKSLTVDELTKVEGLQGQIDTLQDEFNQVKKVDDLKAKNTATKAFLNEPAPGGFQQSGGDGGEPGRKSVVEFRGVSSLKHITGYSRKEAEETAYRFFQFFNAGVMKSARSVQWCKDHDLPLIPSRLEGDELYAMKAAGSMNETVNEQGGVLVPPEFDMMLIRLVETYGVFRKFTKMKPMISDVKNTPRRTGGVTAYWTAAGQTITRSRPSYDNVGLVAKKLAALVAIDSELSEDSAISTADEVAFEIAYAFALSEDQAGFTGDATSTYGGITGVTTKIKGLSGTIADIAGLKVATGNLHSEITLPDFNGVVALLPQYADTPNAAWFCHKGFYHNTMQKLELAAGGVTANEVANGDRRPRPLFLGYPVNFSQVMPNVDGNSQVCALLGDLSLASTMGDRRRVTLFNDPYSLSADDQTQVRGTERIDIVVHDVGNATATAADKKPGPIVGLITAAS
jgi:HK97 family phage major capsid protein